MKSKPNLYNKCGNQIISILIKQFITPYSGKFQGIKLLQFLPHHVPVHITIICKIFICKYYYLFIHEFVYLHCKN